MALPIVIDSGSTFLKAGFAGEEQPKTVFPNVVWRPRSSNPTVPSPVVGGISESMRPLVSPKHPVEYGIVVNWDDMEKVWHHTLYHELKVAPEEHPLLLTEASLNPKANRGKMAQIMFETFNVCALHIQSQAELSLYATGRVSGLVVESGGGSTQIVPIYEGYALPHAIWRQDRGCGRDLTEFLARLLALRREYHFPTPAEQEIVNDIKEKLCYFALSLEEQNDLYSASPVDFEKTYELPDGKVITIGDELFQVPEALMRPDFLGSESFGLSDSVYASIKKCDVEIRPQIFGNIILSGGNTMFPGMAERLKKDLTFRACSSPAPPPSSPEASLVKVIAPPDRKYLAWLGGSVLASLEGFDTQTAIRKEEYDESGPSIFIKRHTCY